MGKVCYILLFVFIGSFLPCLLPAQTSDIGAIGSFSMTKDFGDKWDAKVEQEFRFNNNLVMFDRSLTSVGLNYTIIRKILKAEVDYDFIYQRQVDYFEIRQRSSAALATQFKINSFDFEFRTRVQAIWRDESRGDYKFNPKYVWRNKLECTYTIFGSPVKPFISTEIFCPINSVHGFFMDGFRGTMGVKYRMSLHTSTMFFVRYDQDIQQANPKSVFYGGFGWNYRL
ncbi:MAG: DUF2490 domain-containing protein [Paludibacter sp.]